MNKKYFWLIGIWLVLVIGCLDARQLVLGGRQVKLNPASSLAGSVSMALSGSSDNPAQEGTDFELSGTKYFENDTWVVTNVKPLKNQFNASLMILQKKDAFYQPIISGSAFSYSTLANLPASVNNYLQKQGAAYGPGQ